jgi:hypothetical protein
MNNDMYQIRVRVLLIIFVIVLVGLAIFIAPITAEYIRINY